MNRIDELAARPCRARRGPEHRLATAECESLITVLAGWERVEDGAALRRTFTFPDYHHTLAFVNAVAWIAHRADHHPDLGVHYDRCIVRYSTHDVGGLSENDFICAARVQLLVSAAA